MYIIRCTDPTQAEWDFFEDGPLYWNNEIGWVTKESATRFTKDDIINLNLPIGGQWEAENEVL